MVSMLEGIRVVDFTRAMAGPFATMILGDFGAEIVKIEPLQGDETRLWGPPFAEKESTYFLSINRNKMDISVNLHTKQGVEIASRLCKLADVVIENFRPRVMESLGLDYASVAHLNPRVIYCSISGFGQSGILSGKPGYDIIALAESGLLGITGESNGKPVKFGVPVADMAAGMFAAFSISAALFRREKSGQGEKIDVSLFETMMYWLTHQGQGFLSAGVEPARMGASHPSIAPYSSFRARDGYFVMAAANDQLWRKFCEEFGIANLINDPRFCTNPSRVRNRAELEALLDKIFSGYTLETAIAKLERAGVPCARVQSISSALKSEGVRQRDLVRNIASHRLRDLSLVFSPPKLLNSPAELRLPPPDLGEHTSAILQQIGYSAKEIQELFAVGVVKGK